MSATNYFKEQMTRKVLDYKYNAGCDLDSVLELAVQGFVTDAEGKTTENPLGMKNVCAKLTPQLSDKIDNTANLLGISKRSFIEFALINAIGHVEELMDQYQVNEYHYEGMGEGKEGEEGEQS